jgi:hypothetical protein
MTGGGGEGGLYATPLVSYANYTALECLSLADPSQEVACSSQWLNITDPPSVYPYTDYASLWAPVSCLLWNVTLADRVNVEGALRRGTGGRGAARSLR